MVDLLRRLMFVALLACVPLAATTMSAKAGTAPAVELVQPVQYYYRPYYHRHYYYRFYRSYYYHHYYGPHFYHPYYYRYYRPY